MMTRERRWRGVATKGVAGSILLRGMNGLRKMIRSVVVASIVTAFSGVGMANAQHSVEVQKLSAEGEHLKALAMYELLPTKKIGPEARIAAAKSAWALGLNRQAADEFDAILRDPQLQPDMRTRLVLSRGVIEYQEERYQEAALFAEKAIGYMTETSPLRGRAYLLWGQSMMRTGAYPIAHDKFSKALEDVSGADKAEAHFALGLVEMKLGKYQEAQKHLELIPTDHDRTAVAVRMLAAISLETKQQERAKFWIEKGRLDHPEAFVDCWGDYGLEQVALAKGDLEEARRLTDQASKRFPPSDSWLILMQAALEQAEWMKRDQVSLG